MSEVSQCKDLINEVSGVMLLLKSDLRDVCLCLACVCAARRVRGISVISSPAMLRLIQAARCNPSVSLGSNKKNKHLLLDVSGLFSHWAEISVSSAMKMTGDFSITGSSFTQLPTLTPHEVTPASVEDSPYYDEEINV